MASGVGSMFRSLSMSNPYGGYGGSPTMLSGGGYGGGYGPQTAVSYDLGY